LPPAAASPPVGTAPSRRLPPEVLLAGAAATAALVYDPRAPAADPKRAAALIVAIAALLVLRRHRPSDGPAPPPRVPLTALCWCALVAWSALSLLWGGAVGWRDLATWGGATGIVLAALLLPRERAEQAARLACAIGGCVSSLVAIVQWLGGARGLWIHGGHGNSAWLGLTIALCLPLTLDLALPGRRPGTSGAAPALAGVALQGVGLWLARSRTAWSAALAGVVVALVLERTRRRPGPRSAAVALALLLIAGAAAAAAGGAAAIQRSFEGRLWIWRVSAAAAAQALPWGAGLGRFSHAYLDAQGEALSSLAPAAAARHFVNATTAHDDWLQVAVESGLPGLALLAGTMVAGFLAWRRHNGAGAATFVVLAICAAGDCPLRQPAVVIILALVIAAAPGARAAAPLAHAPAALRLVPFALAAPLLASAAATWLGARQAALARALAPDARLALLGRAADIDRDSPEIAGERGIAWLESGEAEAAAAELERARALRPGLGVELARGNALLLLHRPEQAAAAYGRALRLHPGSFRAHANLASALLTVGRANEAAAHLKIARALAPGHPAIEELADRLRAISEPPPVPHASLGEAGERGAEPALGNPPFPP
jgi:tetratricopeptide (TPR) repeat protein